MNNTISHSAASAKLRPFAASGLTKSGELADQLPSDQVMLGTSGVDSKDSLGQGAPGLDILSASPGGKYGSFAGTSMAEPSSVGKYMMAESLVRNGKEVPAGHDLEEYVDAVHRSDAFSSLRDRVEQTFGIDGYRLERGESKVHTYPDSRLGFRVKGLGGLQAPVTARSTIMSSETHHFVMRDSGDGVSRLGAWEKGTPYPEEWRFDEKAQTFFGPETSYPKPSPPEEDRIGYLCGGESVTF